jgi:hypothetical protein
MSVKHEPQFILMPNGRVQLCSDHREAWYLAQRAFEQHIWRLSVADMARSTRRRHEATAARAQQCSPPPTLFNRLRLCVVARSQRCCFWAKQRAWLFVRSLLRRPCRGKETCP